MHLHELQNFIFSSVNARLDFYEIPFGESIHGPGYLFISALKNVKRGDKEKYFNRQVAWSSGQRR